MFKFLTFVCSGIYSNVKEDDVLLLTSYSLYDAYALHEIANDEHFMMVAKFCGTSSTISGNRQITGFLKCCVVASVSAQRKISEILKRHVERYMERRHTCMQRYLDRLVCKELGDVTEYNQMIVYR